MPMGDWVCVECGEIYIKKPRVCVCGCHDFELDTGDVYYENSEEKPVDVDSLIDDLED